MLQHFYKDTRSVNDMVEEATMEVINELDKVDKVVDSQPPQQPYLSSYVHYALEDDHH